jgi:hypothetical protein
MNNQWIQSTNNFYIREVSQNVKALKPAVYKLEQNPSSGELYLSQIQDKYEFPYKIYNVETDFIDRVKKSYDNTNGNLGILLNGVKGTGKTVTSKQICNILNLPVIIIHYRFEGIPDFINNIQQNVIVFIDEFEKIYDGRDHSVLTIMDGALDNGFRKVFLLTTNSLYINENMIQRPGRIRYLKTYKDLTKETIIEIVDDKLIHTEWREQTIEFISQLETITIDVVKAIIDEVNIHNEEPNVFKDVFNIKQINDKFDVYEIVPGNPVATQVAFDAKVFPSKIYVRQSVGEGLEINGRYMGEIIQVIDENNIVVESFNHTEDRKEIHHYRIEGVRTYHHSFAF